VEFTPAEIEAVTENDQDTWKRVLGEDGNRKIREDTTKYYKRYSRLGDRVLTISSSSSRRIDRNVFRAGPG